MTERGWGGTTQKETVITGKRPQLSEADKIFKEVKETDGIVGAYVAKGGFLLSQNIWPVGRAMNKTGFYGNTNDIITGEKLDLSLSNRLMTGGTEMAGMIALPRNLIFNTTNTAIETSKSKDKNQLNNANEFGRGYTGFAEGMFKAVTAKNIKDKLTGIFSMSINIKKMFTETTDMIEEQKKEEVQKAK